MVFTHFGTPTVRLKSFGIHLRHWSVFVRSSSVISNFQNPYFLGNLYIYRTHIICDFYKRYSIIARSCESEPPETFLGIDVDWPKKSRLSGTKVIYTCPYKKITDQDMLAGKIIVCLSSIILGIIIFVKKYKKYCFISEQYTHCIWDKDTDEMIWYPNEIYECTRKYKYIIKLLIL